MTHKAVPAEQQISRVTYLVFDFPLQSVQHNGNSKVVSGEMPNDPVDDIGLDPSAAHMPQIEQAIMAMAVTHRLRQSEPLQSLLARPELPGLMHVVFASKIPLPQLHQEQLQFPWIHICMANWQRVHHLKGHGIKSTAYRSRRSCVQYQGRRGGLDLINDLLKA